jgi:general secretion pathway protein G
MRAKSRAAKSEVFMAPSLAASAAMQGVIGQTAKIRKKQWNTNMQQRHTRGFTLLEIMVVVAIIAIMAAMIVPKLFGNVDKARIDRSRTDLKTVGSQLEMYKLDNFVYPSSEQGLGALVSKPAGQPDAPNWRTGGYLDAVPKDPWGTPYQYLNPGQHGAFDVYSLGADKKPGGQGADADIGNWDGK